MVKKLLQIIILMALIAAILLINSCEKEGLIGERGFGFSGFVSDSISGLAIDSAGFSIDDTTTTPRFYSDTSGNYEGGAFAGSHTLYVQKTGYYTQARNIVLDRPLTDINFRLIPDSM